MVTRRAEFDKLDVLYTALKDIDKVVTTHDDYVLDDVWNVIKDIDKSQFDSEIQLEIVNSIRNAIEKIYLNYFNEVNMAVGITPDDFKKEADSKRNIIDMKQVVDNKNKGAM